MDRSEVIEDAKAALAAERVERVAEAIKQRYAVSTYMPIPKDAREIWRELARAAIEAMSPPSA